MYAYFTCKIHDSMRIGEEDYSPILLATKEGVMIDASQALPYLSIPDTRTRSIQPSQVSASASDIEIDIYNKGTEISELLYERMNTIGTMFWNEKVEIWGHVGEIKDRLYFGHIEDMTNDPLETIYTIQTMDVFKLLKTDIFTRELGKYIDAEIGGDEEDITDVNMWRLPNGFVVHIETYEGETIRYLSWEGNAIDCIEAIMQFMFSLPQNQIGVDFLTGDYLDYIDSDSFAEVKSAIGTNGDGYTFKFYNGISDPFEFLKEQIFKPCTIFPFITNDGKLGLKIHQQPTSGQGVETFDESKIIGFIEKHNSMDEYVNHIVLDYNRIIDKDTDQFNKTLYAVDPDALKKTRFLSPRNGPLKFELEGINFTGDLPKQEAVIQNIVSTFFTRYATSITKISFLTTMTKTRNIQVGDYIGLEHKSLIEWVGDDAGKRGLSGSEEEPGDPTAHLNQGDLWAGFVNNNGLGTSILGGNHVFLDTETDELRWQMYNDTTESCGKNHADFQTWIAKQS